MTRPKLANRVRRAAQSSLLFSLVLLSFLSGACTRSRCITLYGERPVVFEVEIADNVFARTLGLMFREHLGHDRGMLFVYDPPAPKSFWMKHTRIPLDILFIDENKKVALIEEADPCRSDPCKRYHSKGSVKFVLEINRGLSRSYGFREGTSFMFHGD